MVAADEIETDVLVAGAQRFEWARGCACPERRNVSEKVHDLMHSKLTLVVMSDAQPSQRSKLATLRLLNIATVACDRRGR